MAHAPTPLPVDFDHVFAALTDTLRGPVHRDHPLGPLTTYRVGGNAAVAAEPLDLDDLHALAPALGGATTPFACIGQGSNLLVADAGFAGVAVLMGSAFDGVEFSEGQGADVTVTVGAGARLPLIARRTVAEGLTGFAWAVGVPGSIGGAVRMNAGGHGSDMAATVVEAQILDLRSGVVDTWTAERLDFQYRSSAVQDWHCVISCTMRLTRADQPVEVGETELKDIVRWRREHQPGGQNAGSVFTNPPGDSAGRLIDVCGGKGMRVGSAEVSTKHANFIQADDGGAADDILTLMLGVMALVEERTGILLHPETKLLGYGDIVAELNALNALDSDGGSDYDR